MTKSEEYIIEQLHSSPRMWNKVKDNLDKITLRHTKSKNYGIFYNGIFAGAFLPGSLIKEEELKDTVYTIDKETMEV